MKARIVVLSLILVFGVSIVGCGDATETNDQAKTETRPSPPKDEEKVRADVIQALNSANERLKEARAKLDESDDDSQDRAKRLVGYPAFVADDLVLFVERIKENNQRPLSEYLIGRIGKSTKGLFENPNANLSDPELVNAVKTELNEELRNPELYDQKRFPEFPRDRLPDDSSRKQLSSLKLARLNRLLLEDSYGKNLTPLSTFELTVLGHLENAADLTKSVPTDLQQKDYKKVTDAFKRTEELLSSISGGQGKTLTASDITRISDEVTVALNTLNPDGGSIGVVGPSTWDTIMQVLFYAGISVAIILVLAGIAYLVHRVRTNRAAEQFLIHQSLKKLFERHEKLQQDFTSLKSEHTAQFDALKEQASRLENAYQILSRKQQTATQQAREFSRASHGDGFYEPPPLPVKEEPEFPASAENYLERMKGLNRSTTVIRPDFQNGILIKDAEGRGELVLIEDPYASDWQPLIVVPSVSHFQMKQDFYNYYDTYYDCDQPAAGNVWIVHPAFVEKISGGWRLTEKGRLEVR